MGRILCAGGAYIYMEVGGPGILCALVGGGALSRHGGGARTYARLGLCGCGGKVSKHALG